MSIVVFGFPFGIFCTYRCISLHIRPVDLGSMLTLRTMKNLKYKRDCWAGKFKSLFTSSNPNSSHMLTQALANLEVPVEDLASLSFSAATVSAALNKLKHGKAEGGEGP